jgi:hypothetical protein
MTPRERMALYRSWYEVVEEMGTKLEELSPKQIEAFWELYREARQVVNRRVKG